MDSKKFSIKKKEDKSNTRVNVPIASVFNQDSDEEKDESAGQKFDRKYAMSIKSKDKNIIEAALREDATVYEYDSIFEKMEKQKNVKTDADRKADEEKKPKYMHALKNAHKRRELGKLVHDDNTYKKERKAEAGIFNDKEVFVTDAYRKQIEEREQFRIEIEAEDAIDGDFLFNNYKL